MSAIGLKSTEPKRDMEPLPLIAPPSSPPLPPHWEVAFLSAATINSCERLDQEDATRVSQAVLRRQWEGWEGELGLSLLDRAGVLLKEKPPLIYVPRLLSLTEPSLFL